MIFILLYFLQQIFAFPLSLSLSLNNPGFGN